MKTTKELNKNAIGAIQSIVMGIAGTAPAFSISATITTLIGAAGILSVASLIYCGLIMFGITFAFMHLNKVITNAGASYAWVGHVFHPTLGFLVGWALMVATAVFMVSATIPAATATLTLIAPHYVADPRIVTLVASFWLLAVSAIIVKGVHLSSYVQIIMTSIEVAVLLVVIVACFIYFGHHPAHHFSWHWVSPTSFTPTLFAVSALIALFFFWGWDVTVNLGEETRDASKTAGIGAATSMIIVMFLFTGFAAAVLIGMNDAEIQQSSTNVIFVLAQKLLPYPWDYLSVLAVMLSSIGNLQTSILQFTRTMYAKARDGALNPQYATLHSTWQTPWVATGVITGLGLILLFFSSHFSSINLIIKDSVNAIGFNVAFYYSLAGYACAWYFRHEFRKGFLPCFLHILWPASSATFLVFIAIYSIPTFDHITLIVSIGGIALGLIPMFNNRRWIQPKPLAA